MEEELATATKYPIAQAVHQGLQVTMDSTGNMVSMALKVFQVLLASSNGRTFRISRDATNAYQVQRVRVVLKDILVMRDQEAVLVLLEEAETQAAKVPLDHRAPQAPRVRTADLDQEERQARMLSVVIKA